MVIGLENELSVGISGSYMQADRKSLVSSIVNSVKEIVTAVPSQEKGVPLLGFMLSNGSKIYQDIGDYVESATPEVRTPIEALVYQRANELVLLKALSKAAQRGRVDPVNIRLVRAVTDNAGHYRGMHVNISARNFDAVALVEHLTPFLVTRFYACAGGFGPFGLVMSQKNSSIKTVASQDTRENRGIVNLKNEPLATSPYKRIHITHGDACMSELSTFLSVGCTALVVKMLDDGVCVGPTYTLLNPVDALIQLDNDFYWASAIQLASGLMATAIEIQEHYLNVAEAYVQSRGEYWMTEVIRRWCWAVDILRTQGPAGLSKMLDPYIKLIMYSKYLTKEGLTLKEFSQWCAPVTLAKPYFKGKHKNDVRGWLREQMPYTSFYFLEDRMNYNSFEWSDLPKAIATYNKLLTLDTMFHDISEQGGYFRMRDAGIVNSQLLDNTQLNRAMHQPPLDTRAYARGNAIRESASTSGTVANWTEVRNSNQRTNFFDPLNITYTWTQLKPTRPRR